jgi:hypothetical protein
MKKYTLKILCLLIILTSCGEDVTIMPKFVDETGTVNTTINPSVDLEIVSLSVISITENDFTVSSILSTNDFSGVVTTLYMCNNTLTPLCDPKAGDSRVVSNSQLINELFKNVNPLNYRPLDSINVLLEVVKDSVVISDETTTFTLLDSPIIQTSVSADDRDGETYESTVGFFNQDGEGGNQVFFGNWGGSGQNKMWLYLNFTINKDIPSGSTIKGSRLTLGGDGVISWNANVDYANIYVQDSSDSVPVASFNDTPNESNGNLVFSPLRWPAVGGLTWEVVNTSPDVSSLIQQLVDKYDGLSSGSRIQFWISTPSKGSASQLIYADFGHASHKADLDISWEY